MNKSVQQSLVVSFVVAVLIVCIEHLEELACWFSLTSIGFLAFRWAIVQLFSYKEQRGLVPTESAAQMQSAQLLEQQFSGGYGNGDSVKATQETKQPTGTVAIATEAVNDLTSALPATQPEECRDASFRVSTPAPQKVKQLLCEQIAHLPQKKGRRQVWAALCQRLAVEGGGKVRDANPEKKAEFLMGKGVTIPDLIKAKVSVLTLNAA